MHGTRPASDGLFNGRPLGLLTDWRPYVNEMRRLVAFFNLGSSAAYAVWLEASRKQADPERDPKIRALVARILALARAGRPTGALERRLRRRISAIARDLAAARQELANIAWPAFHALSEGELVPCQELTPRELATVQSIVTAMTYHRNLGFPEYVTRGPDGTLYAVMHFPGRLHREMDPLFLSSEPDGPNVIVERGGPNGPDYVTGHIADSGHAEGEH